MTRTVEEAVVRKSIRVRVPIERAFSVFVEQMEVWWPAAQDNEKAILSHP